MTSPLEPVRHPGFPHEYCKSSSNLVVSGFGRSAFPLAAQSVVAEWDFTSATVGSTSGIAPTSASASLSVSDLNGQERTTTPVANGRGVIDTLLGSTTISGASSTPSAAFDGAAFEVGMNATDLWAGSSGSAVAQSTSYSINFSVQALPGCTVQLSDLTFDLGYDTSLANAGQGNYQKPVVTLYYSLDGGTYVALGTVNGLSDVTTPTAWDSVSGHYIQGGVSISFSSDPLFLSALDDSASVYLKLAFADNSNSGSRTAYIDNIVLNGTVTGTAVPEPSTTAFIAAGAALIFALQRRRSKN